MSIILFFVLLFKLYIFCRHHFVKNDHQFMCVQQYECLVESCGLKFKNYKGRQQHLVDKHKFPTSFEFYKKVHKSKKQRQKQHRKKNVHKEAEVSNAMEVEDETINGLVSAVSKLSTSDATPSSVSFGRHSTRGFAFVPRAVQRERKSEG